MTFKPTPTLVILTVLLVWAIVSQLNSALSWGCESYQMTEWLINYAGGFVRRGLPGTLIGLIADQTGIQANLLVIGFALAFYLALAGWFLRHSTRVFPATLILSCIVMGFPAYQDSIIRKDCLGLLLLLGCLKADDSRLPRPIAILVINLLAGLAILSHEAFVFYALPAFVLLGKAGHPSLEPPVILRRALILVPAAGLFFVTSWHHGTPETARIVHESWMPLWRAITPGDIGLAHPAASIEALGWSSAKGLSLSIYMLTHGIYQPLAWITVFSLSFALLLLFTGRDLESGSSSRMDAKTRITALLVIQLIFISPLFLLGVDYGRWLFFWVASSIMLQTMYKKAPTWLETLVSRCFIQSGVASIFRRVPACDWYLLLFGVPVCWNIHNFVTAGPMMRHLEIIRGWF